MPEALIAIIKNITTEDCLPLSEPGSCKKSVQIEIDIPAYWASVFLMDMILFNFCNNRKHKICGWPLMKAFQDLFGIQKGLPLGTDVISEARIIRPPEPLQIICFSSCALRKPPNGPNIPTLSDSAPSTLPGRAIRRRQACLLFMGTAMSHISGLQWMRGTTV